MIEKKTWNEFREAGMLWYVNRILHCFGWSIVIETDNDSESNPEIYPARTTWFGFSEEQDESNLSKLKAYLKNHE